MRTERSPFGRLSERSGALTALRAFSGVVTRRARCLFPLVVLAAIVTAACGGGELRIAKPEDGTTLEFDFPPGEEWTHQLPTISGGFLPYETSIEGCPDWVRLLFPDQRYPAQRILAGIAPIEASGQKYLCTYQVTEADPGFRPRQSVSYGLRLAVGSTGSLTLDAPPKIDLSIDKFHSEPLPQATGGVQPHTYSFTCAGGELPSGMGFAPETRIFAGRPDAPFRDSCTYSVTDSAQPAQTVSKAVKVEVTPLDRGTWRFRTRTVEPGGPCTVPNPGTDTPVATLPHAQGGDAGEDVYALIDFPENHFLSFNEGTRQLTYTHPPAVPILGTPNTYRYLVGAEGVNAENADDALCLDIQFNPGTSICPDPAGTYIHIQLRVRDDVFWDENAQEYRCPDSTAQTPRSSAQRVSNPVHTALAPVHARRAVDVAHTAVRDQVRNWSSGEARTLTAITPAVGLASLSGENGGFDYSGTSEALNAGAELGAGSWQVGALASFVRTGLHYRAEASLAQRGYLTGEHDTEFLSLHPFAAWHASSGGHVWASLGAGLGELRHRDDLGFPSWSRSDVRLLSYAAGASVPVADMLTGELQVEAGIESFALKIEGGGSISSSLPTIRGRDYRAGLAWSAPHPGSPSISMAYKHLTGDGADGGSLETEGSFSVAGVFDPRLSLTGSIEAAFGLGENDQDLWGLGAGLRFAPDGLGRGFGLGVETRLRSLAHEQSPSVSIHGEAGYGLGGGPFGTIRPYLGVVGESRRQSVQPTLGVALRETPDSVAKIEFRERPAIDRALMFTLWHRL